jgi:thymidylate kinase
MSLIVLEGLDRTGKSTVAKFYESNGYKVVHLSAPPKGTTSDQYLEDMINLISSAAHTDLVLDRSHYGELVWSSIYNRTPLLSEDDIAILQEIEGSVGTTRVIMHDPNIEAHWQRCVENNEPLTKAQFMKARALYHSMAKKFNFELLTLPEFLQKTNKESPQEIMDEPVAATVAQTDESKTIKPPLKETRSPKMDKLDRANAIKEVLSKPILKHKNAYFELLEKDIRFFLEGELNKIFGIASYDSLSNEEISLLKLFCQRLKQKENSK